MAQIPGLPIDEPVAMPKASPGQFGSVGETIAGLGQETEQMAQANMEFEGHLFEAQNYLKAKQAEIAFDSRRNQLYTDLAKATTPEDAQADWDHAKGELDNVLTPFETNKPLARQLALYRQQQEVEIQNNVNAKKADIITKSDHAANKTLLESSAREAINAKSGGGDISPIRAATEAKLQASVHVMGTLLPEQVKALMNDWDKEVESGYIDAQLSSDNVQTIQNTVNDMRQNPGNYPQLDKAELNAFIIKGDNAIISGLSRQDEINAKSEVHKYWNQSATGIPALFTDKNGNFDTQKALEYISSRGLSPEGEKQLISDAKTHGAASGAQLEQQAGKAQTEIVEAGNKHDYKKSAALLEQFHQFATLHPEYSDAFKAMSNYTDEKQSREMSLQIEGMRLHNEAIQMKWQEEQRQSFSTLGQLGPAIQRGEYSDTQLRSMTGGGKGNLRPGQLLPEQVKEAIELSHSSETDPENKPYISSIWNDTALQPHDQARAVSEFKAWIKKYPTETSAAAKEAEVKRVTEPTHVQQINEAIDKLNDSYSNPQSQKSIPPAQPDYGNTSPGDDSGFKQPQQRPSNAVKFVEDGRVYHIPPDQVEEFKADHPDATESPKR